MKTKLPLALLLLGITLTLYPFLARQVNGLRHKNAIAAWECGSTEALIGILTIPALDLTLPVCQGTSQEALRQGACLLEGSDPPTAEQGCHTVLSAHRGLPEDRLFSDLDALQPGDLFSVTTRAGSLTYRVDQILVVCPEDTQALLPLEGETFCTLLTCTPYGINSHRLLVRGRLTGQIS